MADNEVIEEEVDEGDYSFKTKLSWEIVILEELRSINSLIIDTGKNFSRHNILTLKHAIDSWEQSLIPIVLFRVDTGIDEQNKVIDISMTKLNGSWNIENYTECVGEIIKKKGLLIKALAQAGRYMPISTFIYERMKKKEKEKEDGAQNTIGEQ